MIKGDLIFADYFPDINNNRVICKQCGQVANGVDVIEKDESFTYYYHLHCGKYYVRLEPFEDAFMVNEKGDIVQSLSFDRRKQTICAYSFSERSDSWYKIGELDPTKKETPVCLEKNDVVVVEQQGELPSGVGKVLNYQSDNRIATVYLHRTKGIWNVPLSSLVRVTPTQLIG